MGIAEEALAVAAFVAALLAFANTKRWGLWVRLAALLATILLILLTVPLGS